MVIGFALKRNIEVGEQKITRLEKAEEPLTDIKEVERKVEQFAHLTGVNAFMQHVGGRERFPFSDKDETKKVDSGKATEGEKTIPD